MKRSLFFLAMLLVLCLCYNQSAAQRKVTPIESTDELRILTKEELKELQKQERMRFLRTDSLTLDSLRRDSIERAKKKVVRPKFMNVTVGLNLWDPLMRALGQKHGGGEVWASLNIRNRFIPVVEVGVGMANDTPDGANFTYKSDLAVYGKVGMNYNFMFAKDPKYLLYGGLRFAASAFRYDITDVHIDNGYWTGTDKTYSLLDQSSSALWMEAVAGIQVEIVKNLSLGWSVRYNFPLKIKDLPQSRPWYIPGYGTRGNPLHMTLSVSYSLPLHKEKKAPATDAGPEIPLPPAVEEKPDEEIVIPNREERVQPPKEGTTKLTETEE